VSLLTPVLFVLLAWWASTAFILYLDALPPATFRRNFAVATLLALASLFGLAEASEATGAGAAYLAFACALVCWGWLELGFLYGFLTGPRTTACDPSLLGWRRFRCALSALAFHELSLCAGGALVALVSWNAPNRVGLWTYLVLWVMRTSAKLNLFLGVRNLAEELLPPHLRYLESYFRRAPMNPLWPFAVVASTVAAVVVLRIGILGPPDALTTTAALLCGTLLALAVLEHWFMVLPLPADALWAFARRPRAAEPAAAAVSGLGLVPGTARRQLVLAPVPGADTTPDERRRARP
jgi:putative photosynthetic complex assembly protein 2